MKRQLTAAEIEKRDARRAQFKALVKQVANMTDAEKLQFSSKVGAITTASGGVISGFANTMLLVLQLRNPTMVGGFRQWLAVGRCVRKGEHGAMIWVPIGRGKQETAMTPADGKGEDEKPGFIMGTVFDISQTEEIGAGKTFEPEAIAA